LGSYFGQKKSALNSDDDNISIFTKLTDWYGRYIKRFVQNPVETVIAVVAILLIIIMSYGYSGKGTVYFAIVDPVQANITVKARGNFSALETKKIIEQVEERFLKVEGIKNVYLRSGTNWWQSGADRIGGGFVETLEPSQTNISGFEIMDRLKDSTSDLPDNCFYWNNNGSIYTCNVLARVYWSIYEVSSDNNFLCTISFVILFINSYSCFGILFRTKKISS
jgi:multidrug efflux pump